MSDLARARKARIAWLLLLVLLPCLGGCQFLQNEFYYLDVVRPPADDRPVRGTAQPW